MTIATNSQASLIEQQTLRLQQIKDDAQDIALALADQVWDRFENAIEEATEDGFMFDTASITQTSLSLSLAMDFQEVFERDVLSVFEHLHAQLANSYGAEASDTARIDLAGLRKGLKLRRRADALIAEAIESAKPGVSRVLGIIVGDLFRDPMQQMDAIDQDMQKDAQAVRRALLRLADPIRSLMAEETRQLMNQGRLGFSQALDRLASVQTPAL